MREWDDEGATSNWSDMDNWTDDTVPAPADAASIGNLPDAMDDLVILDISDFIESFELTNGADLDTNTLALVMNRDANIGTGAGAGSTVSELIVRPRPVMPAQAPIEARVLTIGGAGQLTMLGGEVEVDGTGNAADGVLGIATGGVVQGFGLVSLTDSDASLGELTAVLDNDGTIEVGDPAASSGEPPAVTLHFTAPNAPTNASANLGGPTGLGTASVARNATLQIDPVTTSGERLILEGNSTFHATNGWTLEADDTLQIDSGIVAEGTPQELPAAAAVVSGGGVFSIDGAIRLNRADEELIITSAVEGVNGVIANNGLVRFQGGGNVGSVALDSLGDGVFENESATTLSLRTGSIYEAVLINEGVLGVAAFGGEADAQLDEFTQTPTGELEIDLAGLLAGEFDAVDVVGGAALGGTLDVSLDASFEPALGNTFTILTTQNGNVTGEFDATTFPLLNGLAFDVVYNAQSVVLEVIAGANNGDFDMDGDVDGADFLKWQRGEMSMPPSAADLAAWQATYGLSGLAGVASVPEPSTSAGLMLVAMIAELRRRVGDR